MTDDRPSEMTIYEEGGVKITTARAVLGGKTYAMSNITSVSMSSEVESAGCITFGLIIGGAAVIIWGVAVGEWLMAGIGLVMAVGGFYLNRGEKTKYTVRIGSSSGEADALTSYDQAEIQKIIDAMNDAIVRRG